MALYAHMLNAFFLCVIFILCLTRLAFTLRLIDRPDFRKRHDGAVPVCGGVAIFGAFTLVSIGFASDSHISWTWQIGLITLVLLGLIDDRAGVAALPKLALQSLAALMLVAGIGGGGLNLGHLTGGQAWHMVAPLGSVLAILFVVGVINSINMLDGIDGLAGSNVMIALLCLALLAMHVGDGLVFLNTLVLAAAVAGFLLFNVRHPWRSRASVFMGDGGSLVLGAVLAIFVLRLSAGPNGLAFPTLLWVVIVPVSDTLSLIARRLAAHRNPLSPDRWHLHYLLVDAGFNPAATTGILAAVTALCAAVAYFGIIFQVDDLYMALGLLVPLLAHTAAVLVLRGQIHTVPAPFQPVRIFAAEPPPPHIVREKP